MVKNSFFTSHIKETYVQFRCFTLGAAPAGKIQRWRRTSDYIPFKGQKLQRSLYGKTKTRQHRKLNGKVNKNYYYREKLKQQLIQECSQEGANVQEEPILNVTKPPNLFCTDFYSLEAKTCKIFNQGEVLLLGKFLKFEKYFKMAFRDYTFTE